MSFNSKQIKTIKFLLIIVVILLVLFIAYVFLGKKMIEGYEYDGGEGSEWTSPVTAVYDWSHVINPTQYRAYVPSRGLTGQLTPPPYNSSNIPRINDTPVTAVYDWRHVINPTQYPAYVPSRGLTGQLTPPPYDSSNIPRINDTPVINTPAPVINMPAPANKNTPATYDRESDGEEDEDTTAPYNSGAYEKTSSSVINTPVTSAYEKTSSSVINTPVTTAYDWSHVVNAYMYPEYVNSMGVTQQPNRPPYDSSNIPSKIGGGGPVINTPVTTDPVTYDWTSWRAMNSSIPETTLVSSYSYDATQPINKQPNKWPGHPSVAALTTDPLTSDPVTYDWTSWRAMNSSIPETTLVSSYSYDATQPINKQPNKWPGHPSVAALTTDPVVTYDWSNWLAINSGVSQATLIAYGYNTSKLITAQPNKWPGHPNLAPLGPAGVTGATGAGGSNIYILPSSSTLNPNFSLYGNNNLLQQQQRLLQQTQSQLQQSQLEQEQLRWQSRLQGQGQGLAQEDINNVRGSSNAPKKKICYAPYKNEKDCENAGYLWDSMKEKCRRLTTNKSRTNDKSSADTNANKNNYFNSYNNDDKYILKTQIVPPVCPACPSYKCGSEPQKLDNSILDDETNNNLLTANNLILNERNFAKSIKTNDSGRFPMPLLADFSQFM